MFELTWKDREAWEAAGGAESIPAPPPDRAVEAAAMLFWEEHCIECATPQCYTSCSLYAARADARCARFAYGIYPNRSVSGSLPYGADIHFRRWGKLETEWPSRPLLRPLERLRRQAAIVDHVDGWINGVTAPLDAVWPGRKLHGGFKRLRRGWAARVAAAGSRHSLVPDGLYLKYYCPAAGTASLHLEVMGERPLFGRSLAIAEGWNEHFIPAADINHLFGGEPKYLRVWIDGDRELRLVFTWLDLVRLAPETDTKPTHRPASKVKCLAWDLDNTLWDGVIGEQSADEVTLYPGRTELIEALDERGILHTVASKNDYEVAWSHLERLGLSQYFLYPAIHWGPKSGSLRQVAEALNIGIDSFAFVDDSPFERAEVAAALPEVRVFDPEQLGSLLDQEAFEVPVTAEGRTRREKYQSEAKRLQILDSWSGDFDAFLRSCELVMTIGPPQSEHWPRCLELIQRSNQFNLSGRRYAESELRTLVDSDDRESWFLEVCDRHGEYGIVGFAVFHRQGDDAELVEFVMSCRVAQKRVEETFLLWYALRLRQRGGRLRATVVATGRNGPLLNSLAQIGLLPREDDDCRLELSEDGDIDVPDVIRIEAL